MKRILVFDFDGVLVDSNRIKQKAFFDLFPNASTKTTSIIKKVLSETKVHWTRFEILKEIFVALGSVFETIQTLVDEYERKYRITVRDEILSQGPFPGVIFILDKCAREGHPLYLNSATPCEALGELVEKLKIAKYFRHVYGRPPVKVENLADIMRRENAKPCDLVMIGDGEEDRSSAEAHGILFIGVANEWNGWNDSSPFPTAKNVFDALKRLEELGVTERRKAI